MAEPSPKSPSEVPEPSPLKSASSRASSTSVAAGQPPVLPAPMLSLPPGFPAASAKGTASSPSEAAVRVPDEAAFQFEQNEEPPEHDDVPAFVAIAVSATAVSFYTSLIVHLISWAAIVGLCTLLGIEWITETEESTSPLMAALGDEDLLDQLPQLEVSADENLLLDTPASSLEQIADQLQRSDAGWLKSTEETALRNVAGSQATDPDDNGSGVLLKIPESGLAVTKGSFTAFTIPANPKPRENYSIVIEVRLPGDVKKFRVSDLSGEVKGSDDYRQKIPYDSRRPNAAGVPVENQRIQVLNASTVIDVASNKVQIVVKVPGANRLVKDTIKIRSRKLKEEQELTLVFGLNPNPPATESEDADSKSEVPNSPDKSP